VGKRYFWTTNTVSNGDLDASSLSAAVDDLVLVAPSDPCRRPPRRIRDAGHRAVLNGLELFARITARRPPASKLVAARGRPVPTMSIWPRPAGRLGDSRGANVAPGYCTVVGGTARLGTDFEALTQPRSPDYARLATDGSWRAKHAPLIEMRPPDPASSTGRPLRCGRAGANWAAARRAG